MSKFPYRKRWYVVLACIIAGFILIDKSIKYGNLIENIDGKKTYTLAVEEISKKSLMILFFRQHFAKGTIKENKAKATVKLYRPTGRTLPLIGSEIKVYKCQAAPNGYVHEGILKHSPELLSFKINGHLVTWYFWIGLFMIIFPMWALRDSAIAERETYERMQEIQKEVKEKHKNKGKS